MQKKKYDIKEVQKLSNTKAKIKIKAVYNTAVKRRISKRKR